MNIINSKLLINMLIKHELIMSFYRMFRLCLLTCVFVSVCVCVWVSSQLYVCVHVCVCIECVCACVCICVLYRPWQQNVCLSCTHLYQLEYTCVCVCACVSSSVCV